MQNALDAAGKTFISAIYAAFTAYLTATFIAFVVPFIITAFDRGPKEFLFALSFVPATLLLGLIIVNISIYISDVFFTGRLADKLSAGLRRISWAFRMGGSQ